MEKIEKKMAAYLAQRNYSTRNDLYLCMLEKLIIWIKSVLKKLGKWETEGEILSLSWDIFEFCLKDYKPETFDIAGHFYTWTGYYLQNRYGIKYPVSFQFDDIGDNELFHQGLIRVDPYNRLSNKETLQWLGAFSLSNKIDVITTWGSPKAEILLTSLSLYAECKELAPYVRQSGKKYIWNVYTSNPKMFSIAENCDGFSIKDATVHYGVTYGARAVAEILDCDFYNLHNKDQERFEKKVNKSEEVKELIDDGKITEKGLIKAFKKKAGGREPG